MSVHILLEGDDLALLERVVGHVFALAGECPPEVNPREPVLVARIEEDMTSIVIYTTGALYTRDLSEIDKPYPWLWALLSRLLSSRLYEALRVGYSKRNTLQAQQARRKPAPVVAAQLTMDEVLHGSE